MTAKVLFYTILSTLYLIFSYLVYAWFSLAIFTNIFLSYDLARIKNSPTVDPIPDNLNDTEIENRGEMWFLVSCIIALVVLGITIVRGKKFPAYKLFGYIAVLNCFFGACLTIVNIPGNFFENDSFKWITLLASACIFLLVWYLQVSLFFLKKGNSNLKPL